jgi:hypothetical protein
MIPGMIAVLLIIFFITEKKKVVIAHSEKPKLTLKHFDWRFKAFVFIAAIFAIGNSSDVFLILRAQQTGIQTTMIPVVYLLFNLIYSLSSIPAGISRQVWKEESYTDGIYIICNSLLRFCGCSGCKEYLGPVWILRTLYGPYRRNTEGVSCHDNTTGLQSNRLRSI